MSQLFIIYIINTYLKLQYVGVGGGGIMGGLSGYHYWGGGGKGGFLRVPLLGGIGEGGGRMGGFSGYHYWEKNGDFLRVLLWVGGLLILRVHFTVLIHHCYLPLLFTSFCISLSIQLSFLLNVWFFIKPPPPIHVSLS